MRVADYIAQRLSEYTKNCYMVTGGGAMHLNDAFSKSSMNVVYCHHEQACAMAAEAEARLTNQFSVVNVTTGPGGINALNGVFGAWTDSIPMIIISGQVKRDTLVRTYGENGGWRQLGDQEADIVNMVYGITKYAVCIERPEEIKYHLEKAMFLAQHGRRGPCWIDVPIDVQAMQLDFENMKGFDPEKEGFITEKTETLVQNTETLVQKLKASKRPVFYLGFGVHASKTKTQIAELAEKYNIPIVTSFNSNDLIADYHPSYVGKAGTIGNRSGNFVVQSSDLVIVLGSRLNIRLVSYNWNSFAPNAYKVGVDIDEKELNKPTCNFDLKIVADLKDFIPILSDKMDKSQIVSYTDWLKWGKERLVKYPVCLPEYWNNDKTVNPYCFMEELSKYLKENEIIACADGTACVVAFQAIEIKNGQRLFHNSGCASMGYDLPAAIGAYYSNPTKERILCIAGDGSIMMNLQELQTISGNNLPIQIFVLYNEGYHSIRQTQRSFFNDNITGCGTDSGLSFPDFKKIADAFDFPYFKINNHKELKEKLGNIMTQKGRFICEVVLNLDQHFAPKLSSKKLEDGSMVTSPLEDMWPFLDKEELYSNIIQQS